MSLYLCTQEPVTKYRVSMVTIVKVVEANSRAEALRKFDDAREESPGYFKAPQAVPLQIGTEYRL